MKSWFHPGSDAGIDARAARGGLRTAQALKMSPAILSKSEKEYINIDHLKNDIERYYYFSRSFKRVYKNLQL